jgi:hypothetical protein
MQVYGVLLAVVRASVLALLQEWAQALAVAAQLAVVQGIVAGVQPRWQADCCLFVLHQQITAMHRNYHRTPLPE